MALLFVRSTRRVILASFVLAVALLDLPLVRAAGDAAAAATRRGQNIHFEPLPDRTLDGTLIPLMATATSGLKVRFAVVSGPAQIVGSQLMLSGPGTVVIQASQAGDATHTAAAPVERSFQVLAPAASNAGADNAAGAAADTPAQPASPGASSSPPAEAISVAATSAPNETASSDGAPSLPPLPTEGAAPAAAAQPASSTSAPSDLIPKALIDAAKGQVGPAAANQIPAKLVLTLPGNVEMIFVRVPAGRATLGSMPSETGHQPDENFHNFAEPQGFLMSATEVTQAQYEALTGQRPSYFRSDWQSRPVEQIRWSDVARDVSGFFAHLNEALQSSGHANFSAALPSDDQWEYACRAGTQTSYNNRTDLNFPINESTIREVATYGETETSNVATHSPNAWGLYDMHGNVAEWTREGSLRGGSFRDSPAYIRSASKQVGRAGSNDLNREAGFRVVLLPVNSGLDAR